MFKDKNLKLALLSYMRSLQARFHYGPDKDYDVFCMQNFGRLIDNDEPSREIEDFFLSIDIPQDELDAVTGVTFDAENIFYLFLVSTVHAMEGFDIESIEGIENCRNLEYIDFSATTNKIDLAPLSGLKRLTSISLESYSAKNYEALLDVPSLKRVRFWNIPFFDPADRDALRKIQPQLEARGVALVDIYDQKLVIP